MIRIPACALCKHCKNDLTCPAHPEGIPDDVLWDVKMYANEDCGNNVKFTKIKDDN